MSRGRKAASTSLTACSKAPGAACCCPAPGPDPVAPNSNSCRCRLTGTSGNSGPLRFCCSIMAAAALLNAATDRADTRHFRLGETNRLPIPPMLRPLDSLLLLVSSL